MNKKLLFIVILFLGSSVSHAAWQDWFKTPEQQAAEYLEQGDAEALIEKAPSDSWKGLGHFQAGELEAATAAFQQAKESAELSGGAVDYQRELFNVATTNVHNGQLDDAIEQFDELLELNPDHQRARHNKEIAQKLQQQAEQQEQQQQQSGEDGQASDEQQDGEEGEQQDGQHGEQGQEQNGQQSEDQNGEQGEQQDGQQGDASDGGQQSADGSPSADGSETDDAGATEDSEENTEAAARAALDAEQEANAEQAPGAESEADADGDESDGFAMRESQQPLTEQQQATEQWLRQIPDDPAGLLRRKLMQSHRIEYPGVQSSEERW